MLANYARHYQSGEAMPAALVEKIKRARTFNQGFATTEYLGAALVDMAWHTLASDAPLQDDISGAQQALDFLEQSAAQLRSLKSDLSNKLAASRRPCELAMRMWNICWSMVWSNSLFISPSPTTIL